MRLPHGAGARPLPAAQMTAPQPFPLLAFPKAWTPGTNGLVKADAVLAVALLLVNRWWSRIYIAELRGEL